MQVPRSVAAVFLILLFLIGCSQSNPSLTVTAGIQTSDVMEALATVEPPSEIILEFNLPLKPDSINGKASLHLVRAVGTLIPVSPEIEVVYNAQTPNRLVLRTKDGSKLPSGEEYRLAVSKEIQSTNGITMAHDYIRCFVTDYMVTRSLLAGLGTDRTVTVVISDIHLGDQRSIDDQYGWFSENSAKLVSFLNYVRQRPDVKELVIAGDMFDEWVAPMDYDAFAGSSQSQFVDKIAAAHKPVIDAFKSIINEGNIAVTYVPGNHDMLVQSSDIQRIFPGIFQARDVQGLGKYSPSYYPELVIEHGHRYDFFNAPDPISNRSITGTDSIFSPGFFVSKIAATSDLERKKKSFYRDDINSATTTVTGNYWSYWTAWLLIMSQKPVKEAWNEKIIRTGADGYAGVYSINDIIPQYDGGGSGPLDVTLYKGIVDNWNQRQAINQVSVPMPAEVAIAAGALNRILDAQAAIQYFANTASTKRVVVFGHTHDPYLFTALNHQLRWSIYANSGTWIDSADPACTFVEIRPKKSNGATPDTVTVYRYIDNEHIAKIKGAAIKD